MNYTERLEEARKLDQYLYDAGRMFTAASYRRAAGLPPVTVPILFEDLQEGDRVCVRRQEDGWDLHAEGVVCVGDYGIFLDVGSEEVYPDGVGECFLIERPGQ